MAAYALYFSNDQLGDFNTSNAFELITNPMGEQKLTINTNHPGDRLVSNGAVADIGEITGWRLTVQGEDVSDGAVSHVVPNSNVVVEYSTDGGANWNSYTTDIGHPDAVYSVRQDEKDWMALTANIPGQSDLQFGFIASNSPVHSCQAFVTDETIFECQVGEYILPEIIFPCFTAETRISTAYGPVAAGDLAAGNLVLTSDNGLQPIRWIARRKLDRHDLRLNPGLRPIRIRAGALGSQMPQSDLLVSPQHRVLVRSQIALRMFGTDEVLVAAKQLCEIDGIDIDQECDEITYVHFLFDDHQIVCSNGAWTESLYTGPQALRAVGPAALEEIYTLFPELREGEAKPAARPIPQGRLVRQMASRHARNGKPLVA
ncbi:Hint domain-containing protein [Paracoccus methylarcula]|uniref:Calcium-binding protein n=1 Tax=Paracoccus methylarcula TaxID=72022 RepID=A0A3R7PPQ1_9RHOB|nr:Hint domain-containing protein [Paracoccus methylarcula]RNF34497.1 calcium-binding protein [Paracoccus methylarcula]